ncbi:metallopeptidase family protein [Actinocorallia sp. A-T 12471]|uniref:metallopeptidase family protein n=1 Tax=Actinocorallia sp. A-T 12471 TaxID=3089813 RepID=UPI0029CB8D7C|nr:metallopeptidase family protein [Actinocorallia sp. A-T 12471]MDX6738139.1 metallopeptidase family protein [Actinocorallia sp. A-T 12471]
MVEATEAEFEELVSEALDTIPPGLTSMMKNVVVVVVDEPPEPGILGLYTGVPLTERGDWYAGVLPDRIEIYRQEHLAICDDHDQLREEIAVTVVHEIAHHFGIDDERLHALGW